MMFVTRPEEALRQTDVEGRGADYVKVDIEKGGDDRFFEIVAERGSIVKEREEAELAAKQAQERREAEAHERAAKAAAEAAEQARLRAAADAASTVSVHLSAPVTVTAVVAAVVLAILGGLIAGSFGGWRAARLRPAAALSKVA